MAGLISQVGIVDGQIVYAEHVLRIIDALSAINPNDILIFGNLYNTGSFTVYGTSSFYGDSVQISSSFYIATSSTSINNNLTRFLVQDPSTGKISIATGSFTSGSYSGSFSGSFFGDGSNLTGIVSSKWTGSNSISRLGNVIISGSFTVSGSNIDFSKSTSFTGSITLLKGVGIGGNSVFQITDNLASNIFQVLDNKSIIINGPVTGSIFSGSQFTGSFFGTSSWAINASQSIIATSASYATASANAITASYINSNLVSSSFWVIGGNSFSGNTTQSIGINSNDTLSIKISGSEIARITTQSNFLIGTSSDQGSKVQIYTSGSVNGTQTGLNVIGNYNGFYQLNLQNTSSTTTSSGDIVVTSDVGSSNSGYINLGINASTNTDPQFTVQSASAGYVYVNGGPLVLGTQTSHDIIFHTSGTLAINERIRITSGGFVGINTAFPSASLHISSSTNTLAILVRGSTLGTASLFQLANDGTASFFTRDLILGNGAVAQSSIFTSNGLQISGKGLSLDGTPPSSQTINGASGISVAGGNGTLTFTYSSQTLTTPITQSIYNFNSNISPISGSTFFKVITSTGTINSSGSGDITIINILPQITKVSGSLIGIDYNPGGNSLSNITGSHLAFRATSGRVLIGTGSAAALLHVSGNGLFTTNLTIGQTSTGSSTLQVQGIGTSTGQSLLIQDASQNPRLVVLDTGSIGINTSVPSGTLHITAPINPKSPTLLVVGGGNTSGNSTVVLRNTNGSYWTFNDSGIITASSNFSPSSPADWMIYNYSANQIGGTISGSLTLVSNVLNGPIILSSSTIIVESNRLSSIMNGTTTASLKTILAQNNVIVYTSNSNLSGSIYEIGVSRNIFSMSAGLGSDSNITSSYITRNIIDFTGAATQGNFQNFYLGYFGTTGSIVTSFTASNRYGVYIGNVNFGISNNTPYGLYQEDTSSQNYFASKVGIGTISPITTLHNNGSTAFGGITSSISKTLDTSKTYWGYTGSTAITYTFPTMSATIGIMYKIYNRGSGSSATLTLTGSTGNEKFYTTVTASSILLNPGDKYELYNDGTYWVSFVN